MHSFAILEEQKKKIVEEKMIICVHLCLSESCRKTNENQQITITESVSKTIRHLLSLSSALSLLHSTLSLSFCLSVNIADRRNKC